MEGQRGDLGDKIVSSRDYLELAKPIVAADGGRPQSRPSTAASPTRSAGSPTQSAAIEAKPTEVAADADNEAAANEGVVAEYRPQPPNRHLHIRDTLLLALRVLEVNKRDGHTLLEEEQALVNSIASFAMSSS